MYKKEKIMHQFLNVCLLSSSDFIQNNRIKPGMNFFLIAKRKLKPY